MLHLHYATSFWIKDRVRIPPFVHRFDDREVRIRSVISCEARRYDAIGEYAVDVVRFSAMVEVLCIRELKMI